MSDWLNQFVRQQATKNNHDGAGQECCHSALSIKSAPENTQEDAGNEWWRESRMEETMRFIKVVKQRKRPCGTNTNYGCPSRCNHRDFQVMLVIMLNTAQLTNWLIDIVNKHRRNRIDQGIYSRH